MVAFYIFGAYMQQFGLEVINTVERTKFRVRKETNSLQELKTLLDLVTNPCMFIDLKDLKELQQCEC